MVKANQYLEMLLLFCEMLLLFWKVLSYFGKCSLILANTDIILIITALILLNYTNLRKSGTAGERKYTVERVCYKFRNNCEKKKKKKLVQNWFGPA